MPAEASKRVRTTLQDPLPSKIFTPFRSLGHVTDGVPFSVTNLGQSFIIVTSVGRSFQIYDASNLHLLFVSSPLTSSPIVALEARHHYVYAAWGKTLGIFYRGKLKHFAEAKSLILGIRLLGKFVVAYTASHLHIYSQESEESPLESYTEIQIPLHANLTISHVCHLPTLLNKLLVVAGHELYIVNIRTGKIVHAFVDLNQLPWIDAPIVSISSSPALDVVGIATSDSSVYLYNIRKGKALFSFKCGDELVRSISFRTDGTTHIALGLSSGDILFYDLNRRLKVHTLRSAHEGQLGGVSKVHYLAGLSVVVSTGYDNKLLQFVFDPNLSTTDAITSSPPRLLRARGGHSQPPRHIIFADEEAHFILTAARDRSLWAFSLRKDSQSHELSQREAASSSAKRAANTSGLREKLPEIIDMFHTQAKHGQWDNVLTAHAGSQFARTWDMRKGKIGSHKLQTLDHSLVKCVSISPCGNFGAVGSASGSIAVYNMQSGLLRKRFVGHTSSITGIVISHCNDRVFSTSLDGKFIVHDFQSQAVSVKIDLGSPALALRIHDPSGLLAISMDSTFSLKILDTSTYKVVRETYGHRNRITSFDFSPDGRWVVTASLDSTIRTWDIPSGLCIDGFRVNSIATCVRFSPTGDWLATSHVQGIGVNLWNNRAQFYPVAIQAITDKDAELLNHAPAASGQGGKSTIDAAYESAQRHDTGGSAFVAANPVAQLSKDLITLSLLPRSNFNTLLHLEAIKARNKPKEPPKKPEAAPFFLSLNKQDEELPAQQQQELVGDHNMKPKSALPESHFTKLLREGFQSKNFKEFISHLKSMSPSSTDIEIRSLTTTPPATELIAFLEALIEQAREKADFEHVHLWMQRLIEAHGDVLMLMRNNSSIREVLTTFYSLEEAQTERLDKLAKECIGLLEFLR